MTIIYRRDVMGFGRICSRIIPNIFVLGLAGFLFVCTEFFLTPKLISSSGHPRLWRLSWVLVLCAFSLWLWCWMTTVVGDPGSIERDLERRGILKRVQQGDIPMCLRHLPICRNSQLPHPPQAHCCAVCKACFLRHDHHCGVTGQCMADGNFKAFALSFFWGAVFGFLIVPAGMAGNIIILHLLGLAPAGCLAAPDNGA
jgi:hypothetical protein